MVSNLWRYYNMWRFQRAMHHIGPLDPNGARGALEHASETCHALEGSVWRRRNQWRECDRGVRAPAPYADGPAQTPRCGARLRAVPP